MKIHGLDPEESDGMHEVDSRTIGRERRTHTGDAFDARPLHQRPELFSPQDIPELRAAKIHEASRLQAVAEMLALLGMLSRQGRLDNDAILSVRGAKLQTGSGSKAAHTQAAHCLPGHLYMDDLRLDYFLESPPNDKGGLHHTYEEGLRSRGFQAITLCRTLRELFERTEVADTSVNQADSHVERFSQYEIGLKELFGITAGMVVNAPDGMRGKSWRTVIDTVSQAWTVYRTEAITKTKLAEQRKQEERDSSRKTATPAEMQKLDMRVLILRCYIDTLCSAQPPRVLFDPGFHDFRRRVMTQ
jgi:hypothetical protein